MRTKTAATARPRRWSRRLRPVPLGEVQRASLRKDARILARRGLGIDTIAQQLRVPRSTVARWVR